MNRGTPVAPTGTAAAECPGEEEPPAGRPLQTRFPKEPHHRKAANDSLAAKKQQASNVICLEIERVEGGRGQGRVFVPKKIGNLFSRKREIFFGTKGTKKRPRASLYECAMKNTFRKKKI